MMRKSPARVHSNVNAESINKVQEGQHDVPFNRQPGILEALIHVWMFKADSSDL